MGIEIRRVGFNRLPTAVRERFVQCTRSEMGPLPIVQEQLSAGGATVGWSILALLGLGGLAMFTFGDFGRVNDMGIQPGWVIGANLICLFFVVWPVLAIVRRRRLMKGLPYTPGRYLFPMDFVDARTHELRIVPMALMADFQGTHHHTNGVYTHTDFVFVFEGGKRESFRINGQQQAENILQAFRLAQHRVADAIDQRDVEAIYQSDVFFEARMNDAWDTDPEPFQADAGLQAEAMPKWLVWASLPGLVVATVVAIPLWFGRNAASDAAAFATLDDASSFTAQRYIDLGGARADEVAKVQLPNAALREAKEQGSVTALRDMALRYPDTDAAKEAREEIHVLFAKTVKDFEGQAADDAAMKAFMTRLFAYLEKEDSPPITVRFSKPSATDLAEADKLLNKEVKGGVVPISGHFDEARSAPREIAIVKSMQDAFAAIFPADVLSLEKGPRLQEGEGGDALEAPSIFIHYDVTWSGDTYVSEQTKKNFVGIRVKFLVSMRLPGEDVEKALTFPLTVEPPERFQVAASPLDKYGVGYAGTDQAGRVYHAMALNAFGQLASKMRGVFFRPGTDAYEGRGAPPAKPSYRPARYP